MAKIDVIMPQMGESIAEGTLSRWIKKVGEAVKRDEPIFEISTDKVDAEIPAPAAGVLAEILVLEGQTVAVQTVVARIETEAGAVAAAPAAVAPAGGSGAAVPPPAQAPATLAGAAGRGGEAGANAGSGTAAPSPAATQPSAPSAPAAGAPNGAETAEERLRRKSTPLVRKIAAEHNIDIGTVSGSGLAGRVTKNDILAFIEEGAPAASGTAGVASVAPQSASVPASPSRPAVPASVAGTVAGGGAAGATPSGVEPWPGDKVEPWSRIRKLTAEHMVMSRRTSAHVSTIFEIDYTRISTIRAAKKKEYADRGVNLTYLAFIAKAVADGLRRHPSLNAAVSGESTVLRRDINLGIAVALDWGLIVPVIRHADELSLLGIARAINDLGERARTKKLSPDEVQKGTFTITNPGVFGSVIGTPIINQPQAAILCVGAIEKQPAVVTVDGGDTLAIRLKGMLSLSFDHRIIDGSDADKFMADVKKTLHTFADGAA